MTSGLHNIIVISNIVEVNFDVRAAFLTSRPPESVNRLCINEFRFRTLLTTPHGVSVEQNSYFSHRPYFTLDFPGRNSFNCPGK